MNIVVMAYSALRQRARNRRRKNRSLVVQILIFLFVFAAALFMALPLIYTISNAFKPLSELFAFPPRFFVRHPTGQNFIDLANLLSDSWVPFLRYITNTLFITTVGTVGHILIASMAAYALACGKFAGSRFIFSLIVVSLMFSSTVTAVPTYIIMSNIGWVDSYLSVIVPAFSSTLGLYLMKQFMDNVPPSLLEAAEIDGAGQLKILWKIVMPVVKPAWLTLLILMVQNLWNVNSPFIFTESKKTLSAALSQVVAGGIGRAGVASVVAVIMMAVPITVFIITQSNVMETMSTSGMKE